MDKKAGVIAVVIIIAAIIGGVAYFRSTGQGAAEPAKFELSDLSVSKTEVEPGESTTASVTVKNTGGKRGTYTVDLSVNGMTRTENVTLDPDASKTVEFDVSMEEEGTYEVSVSGMTKTLGVVKLEPKPPTADFTYSPASPWIKNPVTFDASSSSDPDGEIVSYEWVVGKYGASETGKIVEHTYDFFGIYDVKLTVTDDDGLSDNVTKEVKVIGSRYEGPVASFTYSPESPSVGENVVFNNGSEINYASGFWNNIRWDFGDNTTYYTLYAVSVNHSYSSPGDYEVTLTVVQNDFQADNVTKTVTVSSAG